MVSVVVQLCKTLIYLICYTNLLIIRFIPAIIAGGHNINNLRLADGRDLMADREVEL